MDPDQPMVDPENRSSEEILVENAINGREVPPGHISSGMSDALDGVDINDTLGRFSN